MTNFFYFTVAKQPDDMTEDELNQECESAESYYAACERIGQGIGSKESIRYRRCLKQLETLVFKRLGVPLGLLGPT